MDDGYESPEIAAALLPQAEAVSDAAAAAKPNRLRALAIQLGLVKASPYEQPIIDPATKMRLDLQRTFGAPLPAQRGTNQPMMWPSYATGATQQNDLAWDAIAAESANRQAIVDKYGEFSKAVLNSPLVGKE